MQIEFLSSDETVSLEELRIGDVFCDPSRGKKAIFMKVTNTGTYNSVFLDSGGLLHISNEANVIPLPDAKLQIPLD